MNQQITTSAITLLYSSVKEKTDVNLLADAIKLAQGEKKTQVILVAHLAEIAERRLHLDHGYSSMFDYCVRALRLAEGEVWLRVQVSSCCRKFPELLVELAANTINLTIAGKVSAHLNEHNKTQILDFCRGKSTREVEEFIAFLKPKAALPPSLRKQGSSSKNHSPLPIIKEDTAQQDEPRQEKPSSSRIESLGESRYHLRFAFTAVQRQKMERFAELLGVDNPAKNLAELMEKALDIALKVKDPAKVRGNKKAPAPAPASIPAEVQGKKRSRIIPVAVKCAVFERGGYRCQFTAADGSRCPQRTHLCIDHVIPFAQGGSNEVLNLQLLCFSHNKRKAEIDFGFCWKASG